LTKYEFGACFVIQINEEISVKHLPSSEPDPHVVRIGWSLDTCNTQLGQFVKMLLYLILDYLIVIEYFMRFETNKNSLFLTLYQVKNISLMAMEELARNL
jgi:hypothetical protein